MHIGLGILNATLAYIIEGGALNCLELYKCDVGKEKVVINQKKVGL
jgi:hypothetical protein